MNFGILKTLFEDWDPPPGSHPFIKSFKYPFFGELGPPYPYREAFRCFKQVDKWGICLPYAKRKPGDEPIESEDAVDAFLEICGEFTVAHMYSKKPPPHWTAKEFEILRNAKHNPVFGGKGNDMACSNGQCVTKKASFCSMEPPPEEGCTIASDPY